MTRHAGDVTASTSLWSRRRIPTIAAIFLLLLFSCGFYLHPAIHRSFRRRGFAFSPRPNSGRLDVAPAPAVQPAPGSAVPASVPGTPSIVSAAAAVPSPTPASSPSPSSTTAEPATGAAPPADPAVPSDPLAPRPGVGGYVAQLEPPTVPGGPRIITARSFLKHTKTHRRGPQRYGPGERAIITMASNGPAARMAIVLLQSLRDVGTDPGIEILVLTVRGTGGSPECQNTTWKKSVGREHIYCSGNETIPEEIISPGYVETLRRLGAVVRAVDPIERTPYTDGIAGGHGLFWGMSLNRMMIFNFTQYKKIVWMDGDTIVFKNVDDLFDWPTFTSSITHSCCSQNGPGMPSGGLWVLEPSVELGIMFWHMMVAGAPMYNNDGTPVLADDGVTHQHSVWTQSDMMLVRHAFVSWNRNREFDQLWPKIKDDRHGYPAGLRDLPLYAAMSDEDFVRATWDPWRGRQMPEGFDESMWDGESLVWHALSVHYDQCFPNCDCIPWRTNLTMLVTIHLSCIPGDLWKPGYLESDADFHGAINGPLGTNCVRYFYRDVWLEKYERAHGRLPPPIWSGHATERVRATNMSALMNPPRHQYIPNYEYIQNITGWGR